MINKLLEKKLLDVCKELEKCQKMVYHDVTNGITYSDWEAQELLKLQNNINKCRLSAELATLGIVQLNKQTGENYLI